MSKQKEGKSKSGKTTAAHTPKEKKAMKAQKRQDKFESDKINL
jgi:hypothetical protein